MKTKDQVLQYREMLRWQGLKLHQQGKEIVSVPGVCEDVPFEFAQALLGAMFVAINHILEEEGYDDTNQ